MNPLFLQPLLSLLSKDGFCITADDYRRISIVLRSETTWTVEKLKAILLALLVKNSKQEELFLRQFESFFNNELEDTLLETEDHLNRAFDELRDVVEEASNRPPPQPFVIQSISPAQIKASVRHFNIIISGDNYIPFSRVFVDGREISTHFINAREILATVPITLASSIGTHRIVVCTRDGENCSNPASLDILPTSLSRVVAFLWRILGKISFEQSLIIGGVLLLASVGIVYLRTPAKSDQISQPLSAGVPLPGQPLPKPTLSPTPPKKDLCESGNCKGFAISVLGAIILYCLYLNRLMGSPRDKPKRWDPEAPKHFRWSK